MILKKVDFDQRMTQYRLILWLLISGKKVGEQVAIQEYLIWNSNQLRAFRKKNGYREDTLFTQIPQAQERFDEFLMQQLSIEQLSVFLKGGKREWPKLELPKI